MMNDAYRDSTSSLITPASDCFTIVPQDAVSLIRATKAIYVGTSGDPAPRLKTLWG